MKKFILGLLILSSLLSLTIICNATLIEDQLIDIPAEEEIMPMCWGECDNIPSSVRTAYKTINEGNGWIYTPHGYVNDTYPYLPRTTTYTTYRLGDSERLVIGADGTVYYSPDHYSTWIECKF